jgi:hypothetical protein
MRNDVQWSKSNNNIKARHKGNELTERKVLSIYNKIENCGRFGQRKPAVTLQFNLQFLPLSTLMVSATYQWSSVIYYLIPVINASFAFASPHHATLPLSGNFSPPPPHEMSVSFFLSFISSASMLAVRVSPGTGNAISRGNGKYLIISREFPGYPAKYLT